MRSMHMNPAQYACHIFGGVCALARATGRSPGRVSHWRRTGRIASDDAKRALLALAKQRRLDLTADDLLHGRTVPTGAH